MAYLTFSEYTTMGGTLTETAFDRFEAQSVSHIDRLTHGRIMTETVVRDSVKNLTFELIGHLSETDSIARCGYKSFSNGSVSASYATAGELRAQIAGLAELYLSEEVTDDDYEIPLMYAGIVE